MDETKTAVADILASKIRAAEIRANQQPESLKTQQFSKRKNLITEQRNHQLKNYRRMKRNLECSVNQKKITFKSMGKKREFCSSKVQAAI